MSKGWIALHRKIQENPIWANNQPFDMRSAWIDLLLLANHEDNNIMFDYEQITVARGQHLTSVRQLSARWAWSKNRVLKYLRLLESLQMITRNSNNKRTLITIENYGFYQDVRDTGVDTDKDTDVYTGVDTGMDTGMPQTTMNNNENNINNKAFVKPTVEEVRTYCLERNNGIDPVAFVNFYESKGWMIGKNKMKDWKAAVRTWERSRKGTPSSQQQPKPNTNKFGNGMISAQKSSLELAMEMFGDE